MTDETRKLFDAPWYVFSSPDDEITEIENESSRVLAELDDVKNANRLARLPELCDALKHATHTLCVSFCASCLPKGSETGMATFIQNGCPRSSESCDMAKWWELIRKVRDGE